jgi:hypothetical protein
MGLVKLTGAVVAAISAAFLLATGAAALVDRMAVASVRKTRPTAERPARRTGRSSGRGESHPPALADPGMSLSAHRALVIRPNGLPFGFGSLTGSSREIAVGHRASQDDPPPSLLPHYRASLLLRGGPPLCPASVLRPSRFPPLGDLPSTHGRRPILRHWPSAGAGRQVPTFHTEAQTKLAPPPRRTPPGQSAGTRQAHPEPARRARFRCHPYVFDASSVVRSRSPAWPTPDALKARLLRDAQHPDS